KHCPQKRRSAMETAAILRVRHCGAAIFCRRAPPFCPACGRPLRRAGLRAAPVRLPCPFGSGHRRPRAFLLRPSAGSFLGGCSNRKTGFKKKPGSAEVVFLIKRSEITVQT
uniref:MKRN2 opposite strand protein-like N-terminal domain-containing protein n=1 Tax=Phasianus colchicus TaxID=9054 RepID=A0A669P3F6_PHACC